jgi:hypothetical protein
MKNKMKTLEKLITSGFDTDEKIRNMKIEDIFNIKGLTSVDISNIKELIEAIKNKKVIAFFSENRREN